MLLLISATPPLLVLFFFFNDTATTEIYTLSLHDALPICFARRQLAQHLALPVGGQPVCVQEQLVGLERHRSEEHTSELQSRLHLVCRLLLEKKKKNNNRTRRLPYKQRLSTT